MSTSPRHRLGRGSVLWNRRRAAPGAAGRAGSSLTGRSRPHGTRSGHTPGWPGTWVGGDGRRVGGQKTGGDRRVGGEQRPEPLMVVDSAEKG